MTSRDSWTNILEALKVLRPKKGGLTLRSFDQIMVLAEECLLHFALETRASGEDTYVDKLLENERKIDWMLVTEKQKQAYFKLLIRGTGSTSAYPGFNASRRSRTYDADVLRMETMKTHAMLEVHNFRTTRKFTDWILNYLEEMRAKISEARMYNGDIYNQGSKYPRDSRKRDSRYNDSPDRYREVGRDRSRDYHHDKDCRTPRRPTKQQQKRHTSEKGCRGPV